MKDTDQPILHKDGVSYVLPFILVTCCFALWGFANDITNPMVKAFSKIFRMSVTDGALVQVAFYGGYFAMAFPAAMFIRKYSYKAGILLGLGLYAVGALLFFPAKMTGSYYPFLLAYFILTCGLSFLETSSNPYILSMGTEATATRRLNLAQSFNPMGSLTGNVCSHELYPGETKSDGYGRTSPTKPGRICNGKRCGPVRTDRSLSHYRNSHISYASSDTFYPNAQKW